MITFSFSSEQNKTPEVKKKVQKNNTVKKPAQKKEVKTHVKPMKKIELVKYDAVKATPEYFSYLDENNNEIKFNGIIIKGNDNSYFGKTVIPHKVILTYHPKVETVDYRAEYFTYINEYGIEKIYKGTPEFDLENNTYIGDVTENVLHDEIITIYKEDIK